MHIAVLSASDVAQYKEIMLHAYEHAADAFTSTPAERKKETDAWWIDRIADPTGLKIAFGAFIHADLVGTVALEFSAKQKTKHKALLIGMYVLPNYRKHGLARLLVQKVIGHCQSRGDILAIQLEATEGNNAAISLYHSLGFSQFGTEPFGLLTSSGYRAKVHLWLGIGAPQNAG